MYQTWMHYTKEKEINPFLPNAPQSRNFIKKETLAQVFPWTTASKCLQAVGKGTIGMKQVNSKSTKS